MYKLTLIALLFFFPVFLPASAAHAQLAGIIRDFCDEVGEDTEEFIEEAADAARDSQECFDDFDDCTSGIIDRDPIKCIDNFARCSKRATRDKQQACAEFFHEFRRDYSRASREARRERLKDEFQSSPTVLEKVSIAAEAAGSCGGGIDQAPEPPDPDPDNVCDSVLCESSDVRAAVCDDFVEGCLDAGAGEEGCTAGGLFICRGAPLPEDTDQGGVCARELCSISDDLAERCEGFLTLCLGVGTELGEDECVGGALLICRGG